MDHHSVHAVAIIKNKIDTVDPFYIYEINDRKWNGSGTYIFKSSQTAAEIGLAMDRTARQTSFRDLVAHMDGLHSCVKGFVTLTLWVKNPVSLITHRLACMECESEDTTNVIRFLTLYNEILQKVKGNSSFVWFPRGIMTDENGANKNAVRAVLGQAMATRTWSCTWHYLQCAQRQSLKFPKDDRKIFLDLAKSLAKDAVTTIQYNNILCELRKMCTSTGWMKWLQFWHNKHEHFVPAFRGFFLPYMNIAESGQSVMWAQQPHGKMLSLVDGVYKDISKQMRMDAMYKAADRQEAVDIGKSLNLLDLQLYARKEQEQCAPILARNLVQGNQWLEDSALENPDVDKDDNFYPPETTGHKFVESDDDISSEEIILKRPLQTAIITSDAKKQKVSTSPKSTTIPTDIGSVTANDKGKGRGVGRGRG